MKKRRERIEQLKTQLSQIKVDHENVETELGMLQKDRESINLKYKTESKSFKIYNEMLEAIDNEGHQELPDKIEGDEKSQDEEKQSTTSIEENTVTDTEGATAEDAVV